MTEQQIYRKSFEDQIKKDPYNASIRLVFADWLDENGFDDEASEQRRKGTVEWVEADKWMHKFADKCGMSCHNYDENFREYNAWRDAHPEISPRDPEFQEFMDNQHEEWRSITYEDCIQAGFNYLKNADYFVQLGSEKARDMMYKGEARQFWINWSIITGEGVPKSFSEGQEGSAPFSCSC